MTRRVLVVGSINVDYVIETDRLPKLGETLTGKNFSMNFGGKGANQASAIAKQGCEVRMLGAVGNDSAGDASIRNLTSYGIDCTAVERVFAPTGAAVITVCKGDNHILIDAGANGCVTPDVIEKNTALFEWADIVVMQLEIPVESVLLAAKIAKQYGKMVILNPAPVKDFDPSLYPMVDWMIPNEFEAQLLTGILPTHTESAKNAIGVLRSRGTKNAIVTMGKRGCVFADGDKISSFGIYPVRTVDTTAAGDSFIGGLCSKLGTCATEEAVAYASAVSAITVSRSGAAESIPTQKEVEQFLSDRPSSKRRKHA